MIYIIAGEHSGDFIGSRIISNMQDQQFYGVGGELMRKHHFTPLFDIKQINLIGFLEILPSLLRIIKLQKLVVRDILVKQPSLLITIDSPGFTYPIAKRIKALAPHIKLLHIVAPSVWAYKPKRAIKYAKIYHHLLALLPFEPALFTKHGLATSFVGYIGLEQYMDCKMRNDDDVVTTNQAIAPTSTTQICLTCGSRRREIATLAPIFINSLNILAKNGASLRALFVIVKAEDQDQILAILNSHLLLFSYHFCYMHQQVVEQSSVALCKSGTNTMQIACKAIPMVICYKPHFLSYWLLKCVMHIRFACLINIIANQEIWPELIGPNCTAKNIAQALQSILANSRMQTKIDKTQEILRSVGHHWPKPPSKIASELIYRILQF
ncbi:Lipid-A-disaccharide synthase [Rickettsiales endosymbiont of Paramecium tredecaurelia]|uniref:lipid-A-disaccharide synthase n=1 Tax=Candidatus Sarmatiella mevalonica TaxID=2770581 RepID=UPI0019205371|nr:lipid-A-disaccharide synthase [Candidatus Sarmatiella mevalonica]MBL3285271.1 Lipid-A-disaccharide synthase [Candidatus Sarmatiella mevalonica]